MRLVGGGEFVHHPDGPSIRAITRWAVLLVGLVMLAACSGDASDSELDQIVVGEAGGTVVLVDPVSGERAPVARSGQAVQVQPTWSPDGTDLVWTETSGSSMALVVVGGESRTELETPFASFYNHWDPTSNRIASLGNSGGDVALTVSEPGRAEVTRVASGQPLFISWSADGDRLALNTDRALRIIDLDGSVAFEMAVSPTFQAPIWIPGTDEVIVVVDRPQGSAVVAIDIEAGRERDLLAVSGMVSMSLARNGDRLAVVHPGSAGEVATASLTAQTQSGPGGLYIVDLEGATSRLIADADRGALFWSPEGDRLLSLALEDSSGQVQFQWEVHDAAGDIVGRSDLLQPSATMRSSYLPFADQYAQSYTPWSPDGDRFVFAGTVAGQPGVWIQGADADGGSTRLGAGEYAAWSPK